MSRPVFAKDATCPKCLGEAGVTMYDDKEGEYLSWACAVCGYGWETQTADAAQPQEQPTPLPCPTKPLPCPFCGTPAALGDNTGTPGITETRYKVWCPGDECGGENPHTLWYHTKVEAIAAWNQRA